MDAAWIVNIDFKDEGTKAFADLTRRVTSLATPMNQVAITQGTLVITAPRINEAITAGSAQITGNFTMQEATELTTRSFGAVEVAPVLKTVVVPLVTA